MRIALVLFAAILLTAPSAFADDMASARDIEAAVDSYLASAGDDASLVGGPGSAGYDAGFWIRGGDFLLRINATLQARFESWNWDDEDDAFQNRGDPWAGDTSGFSLPRATLKLSGEACCDMRYYIELEFGHHGGSEVDFSRGDLQNRASLGGLGPGSGELGQSHNFDNTREAWLEWAADPAFNVRLGQVKLPTVRQMMVAPELQQFVDVSLASAYGGIWMPGYTDRNRDHGLLIHGMFGCENEFGYMLSMTNGDGGDSIRNVLDHRSSDNLAYGGRFNYAPFEAIGYEEGALRQKTCQWYGELGVYAFYYADRVDKPHLTVGDTLSWGIDLALGYGGFSFTGHYVWIESVDSDFFGFDSEANTWLAQLGYHFPGTAWEIAARASAWDIERSGAVPDGGMTEFAFGVNYYLNGHGNKLQLDLTFLEAEDDASGVTDVYAGYQQGFFPENSAIMLRFQWQLAL